MATLCVRLNSLQLPERGIREMCTKVSQLTRKRRTRGAQAVRCNHPQASKTCAATVSGTSALGRGRATDRRASPLALGRCPRGMPRKIPADPAGRSYCTLTFLVASPQRAEQAGERFQPATGEPGRLQSPGPPGDERCLNRSS